MLNLDDLRLFAAVAQHGGYTRAAEETGVARSTLSRIVQRLEAELGAHLLHRTTRRIGLTPAGAALLARVQPALDEITSAALTLREAGGEPAGLLRVTTTTDVAVGLLAPVISALTMRHPRLRVETILTLRPVDLVAEQVDVALRAYARAPDAADLSGRRLRQISFGWFAAPSYLARKPAPRSADDLAAHDLVSVFSGTTPPRVTIDDSLFGLALIRTGAGIGLLPEELCADDIARGSLVRLLPDVSVFRGELWIVYPRGPISPNVAAFRDAVIEQLRRSPATTRAP